MNNTNRLTPRSRVDELKALRTSSSQSKKKVTASSLISTISNIVASSETASNNNTLVIFKPSVSLVPKSAKNAYRSPREKRLNFTNISLTSSLNLHTSTNKRVPQPPSQPKIELLKPVNLQEEFEKLTLPINPATALKLFKHYLAGYEHNEINTYKEIYYMGFKFSRHDKSEGFDDDNGNFKLYKGDHICYRYEIIQILGRGSFGQVCKCFDHKLKQFIAIKIIKNKLRYNHQAEIEIKILTILKKKDQEKANNIIHIEDYCIFRKHVCIIFELLSNSLYDLLKSNGFKGLSLGLIRRFAIQILIALKFAKGLNIIHCDLKPENILLKQANKSGIKIIDFGSSCLLEERIYTYIQSRFYRAPEIILGIPYTNSIDMWSFGCILIELFTGQPLFPGESEAEQLQLIMELRGLPPPEILAQSTKKKIFFDSSGNPRMIPNSKGKILRPGSKTIEQLVPSAEQKFLDLVLGN